MPSRLAMPLTALLCSVAAAISVMLAWQSFGRRGLPGCGPGSNCELATSSRWAKVGPFSVALFGALVYATMAALALINTHIANNSASSTLITLAALTLGAAAWFTGVQLLALARMCLYCTIVHVCGTAAAILILVACSRPPSKPTNGTAIAALAGIAAAAGMAAIQLLVRTKAYVVERTHQMPEHPTTTTPTLTTAEPWQKAREVNLLSGRVVFDATRFPVIGSPDARFIIGDVLDYTCEHCRNVYPMLEQAITHFDDELAIAILLAPMESEEFPPVVPTDPRYVNGRAFARLSLAVWEENPSRFKQYHHWLLEKGWRGSVDEANGVAAEQIGALSLERALRGSTLKQRLDESLAIYHKSDAGRLPKLLLPKAMLWGNVDSIDKLVWVLDRELRGVGV